MESHTKNSGAPLDLSMITSASFSDDDLKRQAESIVACENELFTPNVTEAAWLLKAITFIDLTTLAGDDTEINVAQLCRKALNPLPNPSQSLQKLIDTPVRCASVCVYPARVKDAYETIKEANSDMPVASVACGFPSGQTTLRTKLVEIEDAIAAGAAEIDIVISRRHVIRNDWVALYEELKALRKACGTVHMKTILAVGELLNLTQVYQASMVAMMAGSDFIKTSTGKEAVNATLPAGLIMCMAIKDYHKKTGFKVGLKPAGGLRTCQDAINWMILVKKQLGDEWLTPSLFRIGASGLLNDIEKKLAQH